MRRKHLVLLATLAGLALLLPTIAQLASNGGSALEKALENKQYKTADSLLQTELAGFYASGRLDTIATYVTAAGTIAYEQYGAEKGTAAVFRFIDTLDARKASPRTLVKVCREAAEFFANNGQNSEGYRSCELSLDYAQKLSERRELEMAQCEYNLGVYAQRLANYNLSQTHHRRSLQIRQTVKGATPDDLYASFNAMGGIYWYASKYDSAALCYSSALENVKKMPENDLNRLYRPAMIYNNLAALQSAEGKTSEGIRTTELTISYFQQFIASKDPHPKKKDAVVGLFAAIDNLAGLYKEVGDYGKAGDLLRYAYQEKLKRLNTGNPGIFISEILLGQHYNSIHEYDSALIYLTRGLEKLEKTEGDYLFWAGDAHYNLAMVFANRKETAKATYYYEKAEAYYDSSYQGDYDNIIMDFLRNAAIFYAKNNQPDKALSRAKKVYAYLVKVGQAKSLQAFYQLLNLAEVSYLAAQYNEALNYSGQALKVVNEKVTADMTLLDSVKIDVFKPKAILLQEKAGYALQKTHDTVYLSAVASRLNQALQILEKRKVLIDDAESINILIADNTELIDFTKQIELELYEKAGQTAHLDRFINLHESGLYNRIRSRLDKKRAIRFSNLPLNIQEQEQQLKAAITTSLNRDKSNTELIQDYLAAVKNWEAFLVKVKEQYPVYYTMRYASIFRSLPELQSTLPANTTLVRYFFTGGRLVALVADSVSKKLVSLDNYNLESQIAGLLQQGYQEKPAAATLSSLYQVLWAPLAPAVSTKKVLIIPDGILFNFSFELLTPTAIRTYSELAGNSLLAKHEITYHYSLFMSGQQQAEDTLYQNYVAFAPGFSDELKKEYVESVNDSLKLDMQYLSLLPQPNTGKLVKKFKSLLGGQTYLNRSSTPAEFRKSAGGHKIIHIGTHAEYNNINPERSRLIFAKTPVVSADTNSLFLYDIYNCNVSSDLTLLTACETGRPGYQDGEGMVSLAHAFNYAGSRSILTGLWKIDEQSSSQITESFIRHLKEGLPSDEALRQAKLDYLSGNPERLLAPAYWSGLVLMGKPGSIQFDNPGLSPWWWVLAGACILAILLFLRRKFSR